MKIKKIGQDYFFVLLVSVQSISVLLGFFLGASLFFPTLQKTFFNFKADDLKHYLNLFVKAEPQLLDVRFSCEGLKVSSPLYRLSVVDSITGKVRCDTAPFHDPNLSILDRSEISQAMQLPEHMGVSIRMSKGLGANEGIYVARYFPEQKVLFRVGQTTADLAEGLWNLKKAFYGFVFFVGLLTILTLVILTRRLIVTRNHQLIQQARLDLAQEFAANVSHELRTPLTSIQGFAATLRDDVATGKSADPEFIQIIVDESQRLLQLVNQVLDMSAIQAGRLKIHPEMMSIHELTDAVIKRLQKIVKEKGIQVITQYDAFEIFADRDRLHQIILNLLSNAIQYSPPKSIIRMTWLKQDALIVFQIQDQGPGIAPELAKNLFERFSGSFKKSESSGLGLSITRGLVELHRGQIKVDSSPGKGTLIQVEIPMV